jgi:hypothetical protein
MMQVRICPTKSTYVPIMERLGYSNLGKPAELLSSEFDEEVDLNNSDKDIDWGEVTDKNADAECLYCEGLFSDEMGIHRLFSLKT